MDADYKPEAEAQDADIQAAVKASRCPMRGIGKRLGQFFKSVARQSARHPWWSVGILASSLFICPICKYFASMLLAGGMIWACRLEEESKSGQASSTGD